MMKLPKISNPSSPKEELDKKLLEAEREYRSGLTTLRDLIAPAAFVVNSNSVEVSGKLARSFFVISYPRYISVNWLSPIISMDTPMDMAMYIYPMDTEDIMKK